MQLKSKEELVEEFRIQTIQEAALRVIARNGLSGASMQEIAAEAGIAKGTIYLYFKNQQELLEAVIEHSAARLLEQLRTALSSSGTFRQRFQSLLRSHIDFFDTHRDIFQIHVAAKYPESGDTVVARCDRASRPHYQNYMKLLTAFLEEAAAADEIRCTNPRRLALFLEEGVGAVLHARMAEKKPAPVEEEVEWITSVVLDGIARKRSRS